MLMKKVYSIPCQSCKVLPVKIKYYQKYKKWEYQKEFVVKDSKLNEQDKTFPITFRLKIISDNCWFYCKVRGQNDIILVTF